MVECDCPVCGYSDAKYVARTGGRDGIEYNCNACGGFFLARTLNSIISNKLDSDKKRALLSHYIRQRQRQENKPEIDTSSLKNILDSSLPNFREQLEKLIMWLADETKENFGRKIESNNFKIRSTIGAIDETNANAIIEYSSQKNFIFLSEQTNYSFYISLTFDGWEYSEEIKFNRGESKKAFMAMQFQDDENYGLYSMFKSFQKAITIKNINFDLFRTDEEPKAGSIPDKIVVDIQTSRFVIADLTYKNPNVYWEAGYAEALGKPVIYTCEESFFEEIPFDIRHKQTIKWDKNNLNNSNKVIKELKATIRATLPEEAKMEDAE